MSETMTTGKVKAALAADSAMKDSDVSVTQKMDGVTKVESSITVK